MCASVLQQGSVQFLDLGAGLIDVRELVRGSATEAGLPSARVAEVVLAAHEVAMNALTHGRGTGSVRVWIAGDEFVCEVEDQGPGMHDPQAGLSQPDPSHARGRGLWITRQLCDLVEVEPAKPGTRVRLHVQLARDA
jgi:anti-sigma regulatory factor (Ser/Thr protein kinase)